MPISLIFSFSFGPLVLKIELSLGVAVLTTGSVKKLLDLDNDLFGMTHFLGVSWLNYLIGGDIGDLVGSCII